MDKTLAGAGTGGPERAEQARGNARALEREQWDVRAIEREARRAGTTAVLLLAQGERLAWTEKGYAGLTNGVSDIHRAYDDAMTYCEADIPSPVLRLPPLRSLDECPTCAERCASGWEKTAPETTLTPVMQARSVA